MKITTCNKNDIGINSYVLQHNNHAIVIDPNNYKEILKALGNDKLDYILLTHEHFDHIMAVDELRLKYDAQLISQKFTSENIQSSSKNLSKFSNIILDFMNKKLNSPISEITVKPANITFDDTYELFWQGYKFFFKHTPGHSAGSSCILVEDFLFAGDSLFESCETSLKGPGTKKKDYLNITMPYLNSLKDSIQVFAGHYNNFRLEDKLNAKEQAIKIFKNRCKYTNCFVNYKDFLNLIENCYFFVRENSIFILKKEEEFYRFYYFLSDYKAINDLNDFFQMHKKTIILEVASRKSLDKSLYNNIGFSPYKVYSRYSADKKSKKFEIIEFAKVQDIEDIKKMIDNTFDVLVDYVPSISDLNTLIGKEEIFIIKQDNEIAGIAIYEKKGAKDTYYLRLTCVHPDYRGRSIGYYLISGLPLENKRCTAWIDDDNKIAKKLDIGVGYKADGLKNYILILRQ